MKRKQEEIMQEYKKYFAYIQRPGAKSLLDWIESNGFFSAPASKSHHGSFPGGLALHSANVFKRLSRLNHEEERRQQYRKRSEATEQETVIQWCGWHEGKHPELKLIFHIPNGGSRNTIEAANLKRQGVKAGVPDLCLPVPMNGFHGLYIEMKYGKNKSTEKQEKWQKALREQGYYVAVCYGAEEAERLIASYLNMAGYPALEQAEKGGINYADTKSGNAGN